VLINPLKIVPKLFQKSNVVKVWSFNPQWTNKGDLAIRARQYEKE